jgi:hypothetical protein
MIYQSFFLHVVALASGLIAIQKRSCWQNAPMMASRYMEWSLMCARAEEDGWDNRGRQLATRSKIDGHVQSAHSFLRVLLVGHVQSAHSFLRVLLVSSSCLVVLRTVRLYFNPADDGRWTRVAMVGFWSFLDGAHALSIMDFCFRDPLGRTLEQTLN